VLFEIEVVVPSHTLGAVNEVNGRAFTITFGSRESLSPAVLVITSLTG